VINYKSQWPWQ